MLGNILDAKGLVIGAGVLLLWGFIGGVLGIQSMVEPLIYIAAGLVPAYYLAQVPGAAGYIGTLLVIWIYDSTIVMGGA